LSAKFFQKIHEPMVPDSTLPLPWTMQMMALSDFVRGRADMKPSPAGALPASTTAELIVRNGRQQGVRRPLTLPVTVVGSAKGCDVRLDVDGVRPIHCLIGWGPEGPLVRSWGGDETYVNDEQVLSRVLTDDDILRVGPFEFSICSSASPASTTSLPVDLRDEQAEIEADLIAQRNELAADRLVVESQREEVESESTRLLQLRRRLIQRWKKHWKTRRLTIERQTGELTRERFTLAEERARLEAERRRFEARVAIENRRLEFAWDAHRIAERKLRDDVARERAEMDYYRRFFVESQARLAAEREHIRQERLRAEHHAADLRVEADGLESRVVNLRAVLLQLESRRADLAPPRAESVATEEIPVALPDVDLVHLAETLADQRRVLLDQVDRLALARESWRGEEVGLLDELTILAEQLRHREQLMIGNEEAAAFGREQLDQERTALKILRERLEAWESRLGAQEAQAEVEATRRDEALAIREREIARREGALGELFRRLSDRRRQDVARLRAEQHRCEKSRRKWAKQRTAFEESQQSQLEREGDLVSQELALELARQEWQTGAENTSRAAHRLARLDRRIQRAVKKERTRLSHEAERLAEEREKFEELFKTASDRILQSAIVGQNAVDRLQSLEQREYQIAQREAGLAAMEALWKSERYSYQSECENLGEEVERLAGLLLESGPAETHTLARAA